MEKKSKTVLVCHVLNQNKDELFSLLDNGKYPELVSRIEVILNENKDTITDKAAIGKCITTLRNSVRNPNKLASTLWTWMNPSAKILKV